MKNFRKLIVWQKAHEVVLMIYSKTKSFPGDEKYNMVSQMRRAATSIPTNIAEGCGKLTQRDFARYLHNSHGSALEVEYLSFLAYELKYLNEDDYKFVDGKINEVKAILITLINKIHNEDKK
jgi:four helix bundle protein